MNKNGNALKRFLTNKNTVTILGVLIGALVLIVGYNYRVNSQIEQVTVLVAKENIQPRTQITESMVETVSIAKALYDKMIGDYGAGVSLLRNASELNNFEDGAFSNVNALIPKGTPLIRNVNVVNESEIPSSVLKKVNKGEVPYAYQVDPNDTYGNSIMPDSYVDVYMKYTNDEGKIVFGKFIENVKVLAVLDSSYRDVFENTAEQRTTSLLFLSLSEDYHLLLRKARYLSIELVTVPVTESIINEDYEGTLRITSSELRQYIEDRTVNVTEDQLPEADVPNIEIEETNKNNGNR